jgi:hypothetical protein
MSVKMDCLPSSRHWTPPVRGAPQLGGGNARRRVEGSPVNATASVGRERKRWGTAGLSAHIARTRPSLRVSSGLLCLSDLCQQWHVFPSVQPRSSMSTNRLGVLPGHWASPHACLYLDKPPGATSGVQLTSSVQSGVGCVSIFTDKNRCHTGKSQSKKPPKRTQRCVSADGRVGSHLCAGQQCAIWPLYR